MEIFKKSHDKFTAKLSIQKVRIKLKNQCYLPLISLSFHLFQYNITTYTSSPQNCHTQTAILTTTTTTTKPYPILGGVSYID